MRSGRGQDVPQPFKPAASVARLMSCFRCMAQHAARVFFHTRELDPELLHHGCHVHRVSVYTAKHKGGKVIVKLMLLNDSSTSSFASPKGEGLADDRRNDRKIGFSRMQFLSVPGVYDYVGSQLGLAIAPSPVQPSP